MASSSAFSLLAMFGPVARPMEQMGLDAGENSAAVVRHIIPYRSTYSAPRI